MDNQKAIFNYLASIDGNLDEICEICFKNKTLYEAIIQQSTNNDILNDNTTGIRLKNGIIEFQDGDLMSLLNNRSALGWIPLMRNQR